MRSNLKLRDALAKLRNLLSDIDLSLDVDNVTKARKAQRVVTGQLDDYVLPRLEHPEAPLVLAVAGSTGVGKSTLINSLVTEHVTDTGALRPTTRTPVLVHHPDDAEWFADTRILPDLTRVTTDNAAEGTLLLAAVEDIPQGIAVMDTPDIDSVVAANHDLATDVLAAADVYLFVTTASRYADANAWSVLSDAAGRRTATAVALNRVTSAARREIERHLATMLARRELGDSPMFVVEEAALGAQGLLGEDALTDVRFWLYELVSEDVRTHLVEHALSTCVEDILHHIPLLEAAQDQQQEEFTVLRTSVRRAFDAGLARFGEISSNGSLLPGQSHTEAGELPTVIARDLAAAAVAEAQQAHEAVVATWKTRTAGPSLLSDVNASQVESTRERAADMVTAWQNEVRALAKSYHDREALEVSSQELDGVGVDDIGVALMITTLAPARDPERNPLFTSAKELLESRFDSTTVRRMAASARSELSRRASDLFTAEASYFLQLLPRAHVVVRKEAIRDAVLAVHEAGAQNMRGA